MSRELAPVVLFIYNRPEHTRRALEALNRNLFANDTILYVYADGPKQDASVTDLALIDQTRAIVMERQWCKEIYLIAREQNMHLEDNIIDGVTQVVNKHGRVIVLEDDLITSPYFLKYCNDSLDVYENAKQVFSINGFMFPIDFESEPTTFLSPLATSSWGWATWADRWQHFEMHPKYTTEIASNPLLRNRFNIGTLDFLNMLQCINSWDIRWYYTAFIRNALGLFPTHSLVENIGFDSSGTHQGNESLNQSLCTSAVEVKFHNCIDIIKYSKVLEYFKDDVNSFSITKRLKNKLKRCLRRL